MAGVDLFSGDFLNSGVETTVAVFGLHPGSMSKLAEVASFFDDPKLLRLQIRRECFVIWFSHPDCAERFIKEMNCNEIDGQKVFVTFEGSRNKFRNVRIKRAPEDSNPMQQIDSQPISTTGEGYIRTSMFQMGHELTPMGKRVREFQATSFFSGDDDFEFVLVKRGAEDIKELLNICKEHQGKIAGGFVRWMCSPNDVPTKAEDIDIFLPSLIDLLKVGAKLEKIGYVHRSTRENMSVLYTPKRIPSAACSSGVYGFSRPPKPELLPHPVQLVIPREINYLRTISDQELISYLDFTVTRIVLVDENIALADADFLTDERQGRLVIRNIVCPISGVRRVSKYTGKGYHCTTVEIVKLFAEFMNRALLKDEAWVNQLLDIGAKAVAGKVSHSEMAGFFATMYTD